nr:MAG TPA: hypothetical protein [Caudoviricetes sp.]
MRQSNPNVFISVRKTDTIGLTLSCKFRLYLYPLGQPSFQTP